MSRGRAMVAVALAMAAPAVADEARYLVAGTVLPVPAAVNGYVQQVSSDHAGAAVVQVSSFLTPLEVDAVYTGASRPASGEQVPDGFLLPGALAVTLHNETDAFRAATAVLEWVARSVHLDIDDMGPQDAVSVIRRGVGRCSGLANATAALLITAGFEARTVSGLLITDDGAVPHRWVECELPGVGWVPTDPTLGLWVVTARHMRFASTVTELPEVQELEPAVSDLQHLPRLGRWPVRPNQGSSLVCRLAPGAPKGEAVAVLEHPRGEVYRALLEPDARFDRLLPGSWRLEVRVGDRVVARSEVELEPGREQSVVVTVP